jgi:hypothetical protein
MPVVDDLSLRRTGETGREIEKRRFTASRRSEQDDDIPATDPEVHVLIAVNGSPPNENVFVTLVKITKSSEPTSIMIAPAEHPARSGKAIRNAFDGARPRGTQFLTGWAIARRIPDGESPSARRTARDSAEPLSKPTLNAISPTGKSVSVSMRRANAIRML